MKQAGEQTYVLGLTSNTDWELARQSPANVWLVNSEVEDIDRVLAAIGNSWGDPADITTAADYDLLQTARLMGDTFKAATHSVNAYQVPKTPVFGANMVEAAVASIEPQPELRNDIKRQHEITVKAISKHFDIRNGNVHIREGHPSRVIPDVADVIDADLIVMGAKSIGRLERLLGSVTTEPVIAETSCDILIVRDGDPSDVPVEATKSLHGVPKYDIEHAIVDPEDTFDSPREVVDMSETSFDLRRRILQAWEYDIRAEMAAENEGGKVRDINVNALDEIDSAKALLDMKQGESRDAQPRLGGAAG